MHETGKNNRNENRIEALFLFHKALRLALSCSNVYLKFAFYLPPSTTLLAIVIFMTFNCMHSIRNLSVCAFAYSFKLHSL